MTKQFWAVIAAIILIFVGIVAFGGKKTDTNKSGKSGATLTNHVEGKNSAHVTLVEYGDYQCPFCQVYTPTVKAAEAEFDGQIALQFRNFPLTNAHPNAFASARAAEAAALQNKFWEMHDVLYANNDPQGKSGWVAASDPTTYFDQFATQIGLNLKQFKTDFASSKVNDLINADLAEGTRLGVSGTPTFFINGKKTEIGNDLPSFEKAIKAAIKAQPAAKPAAAPAATPAKSN